MTKLKRDQAGQIVLFALHTFQFFGCHYHLEDECDRGGGGGGGAYLLVHMGPELLHPPPQQQMFDRKKKLDLQKKKKGCYQESPDCGEVLFIGKY